MKELKQEHKDFIKIQKDFFGDVGKMYLAPFKAIVAFFGVLFYLPKQMIICAMMDSDEYQKLQDLKFKEENQGEILEEEGE